ncbi:MAG: ATP-binding protein [bacterium]|nr:ATP-binding protein [bacterium]
MQALSKSNDSGKYIAALGDKSEFLALKVGTALGEAKICRDLQTVRELSCEGEIVCLIFSLSDPDAAACEELACQLAFDVRLLVCAPDEQGQEMPADFFMVCTNLNFSKPVHTVVRDTSWHFWALDQEGQSIYEKYRKVMNRVSDGIVRFNAGLQITFANKTFCRWCGINKAAGMSVKDIFDEQSQMSLEMCVRHLRHGIILPFTVILKNEVMAFIDPIPRFRSDGEYDGMLALLRLWDADSEAAKMEYEASRTTQYLFSLTSALNATFDFDEIISEVVKAVLGLCGDVSLGVLIDGEAPVYHHVPEAEASDLAREMIPLCSRMLKDRNISVLMDLDVENDPLIPLIKKSGYVGAVCLDLHATEEHLGYMWILLPKKLEGMREISSILINTGALAGIALRNALNVRAMLREQRERRCFYRDALAAVTNNKLILCEYDEFDRYWHECQGEATDLLLAETCDVPQARHLAADLLSSRGLPEELSFNMATCASEAATNVIKYGSPGKMSIKIDDKRIRMRFDDKGKGIAVNKLPKAILASGYSESPTPSLGLGFSLMLKLCTTLRIATGHRGTFLLLEADIEAREADLMDSFVNLPN